MHVWKLFDEEIFIVVDKKSRVLCASFEKLAQFGIVVILLPSSHARSVSPCCQQPHSSNSPQARSNQGHRGTAP